MNEQEIEALVNELTAAGATEQEIATILDEKIAQAKKTPPPPTEPINTPLPSNTASNGAIQPEQPSGFLGTIKGAFQSMLEDAGTPSTSQAPTPIANAFQRGLNLSNQAEIISPFSSSTPTSDQLSEVARLQKETTSLPSSDAYQKFNQSKSFGEAVSTFAQNPTQIIGELTVESLASLGNYGASRMAVGAGIGGGLGSVVPGIGTAAGAGSGIVAGLADTSLALEYTGSFLESLQEAGVDTSDPSSLQQAFSNDELISEARSHALKKGIPIAIFDLISGGVAGKIISKPAKSLVGKVAKGGAEFGIQAALGGSGEAAGQLVSGEELQPGAILGEMLGELGTTPIEVSVGLLGSKNQIVRSANEAIAESDTGNPAINNEIDQAATLSLSQKQVIDAIQEQETGQVPVQPEAGDSKEVPGTQPKTESESPAQQETQEKSVADLAKEFNDSGVLLGQEPTAEAKPVIAEQVADFLRSKNITNESQVNEFIDEFNALPVEGKPLLKIADAKRAYELLVASKPKPFNGETVERTVNEEIKRIAQERAKGKTEGTRIGQDFKNNLVSRVQEAMKESNLTPKQINSILTKVRRTNAFTAGSVSKLGAFVNKVMADANYVDTVDLAYNLRSKIKKQAKSKEIPQNIRNTSKEFAKLDLESFDSVEDYNQLAEHITSGMSSPKGNKYSGFDEFKVTEKINEAKRNQEKAQLAQMLDDFGDFDVDQIILDDTSIEETLKANEAKRDEIMEELKLRTQVAKESLETAPQEDFGPEEKATVNTMLNADLNSLSAADMVSYVRIADNIVINGDFSGAGVIEAKLKAAQVAPELLKLPRNNKVTQTNALTAGTADFYSVGQLMDAMVNNQRSVAEIEERTGIAGIFEAGSVTNNMTQEKIDLFKDFLNTVKKKYKNKPDVSHIEEQWKGVILKELARNTDDVSHLPKVKANLEQSIRMYSKVDPKLGKKMEEYYAPYRNVLSSTETIERFKKNDPQIHEIWQWFRDNVFDDGLALAAKNTTNKIYNQSLVAENNYLPSSQKRVEKQAKTAEDSDKTGRLLSLKPQQAKNTLKATRSLALGNAYDLNLFGSLFKAYHNTLYDINSAKHIQLLYEMSKRPEFEEVIGGIENKNAILTSLEKRLADQRGDTQTEGNFVKMFNNVAHILKDLGVAKALGGVDQLVTQTVPTWISASINLGKDAKLMFARVPDTFIKDVIGKSRTSEAGKRKGGTDLGESSERYLSDETKGGVKIVEDIRRGVKNAADFSLGPLTRGDLFVRRQAFAGFYTQRLIEQGVDPKTIDLNTEGSKQNEEQRKVARAYADHMIATLQVPSNRAEMGEFLTRKGGWDTVRTLLFPFSVFPVNTKIRFTRAVNKIGSDPKTDLLKWTEGKKELAAVISESITFGAIKTYFLAAIVYPAIQSLIRAGFGLEEPDKEEDRSEDFWAKTLGSENPDVVKNFRKLSTSVYNDFAPSSIGPGTALTAFATNYTAYAFRGEDYQDYTYDEWLAETRGLVNQPYESEYSNWGVLGVGSQQLKEIGDAWWDAASTAAGSDVIYYNTMFGTQEAEVEGVEDLIYWNSLMEAASIVTPREFDNAWKKVYQEQLEDYSPTPKRSRRQRRRLQAE